MAAKKKIVNVQAYGSKTQFVMGLPHDTSAKEVVARGKAKGLVLSEAHVYKIRSTNKSKAKGVAKKAAGKGAKKSTAKAAKGTSLSKRDFVLSFSASTPAAEVLKKAKQAGLGLSKAYLYTVRAEGGAKSAKKSAKPAAAKKKVAKKATKKKAAKKVTKKAAKKATKKKAAKKG